MADMSNMQSSPDSKFRIKYLKKCNLTLFVVLIVSPSASGFFGEWGPDLEGPWCATRPRGQDCCDGRQDTCAVPILGTECYCDIFCNLTAYDCCPDYWQHCHGYRLPTTTPRPTTLPTPRPSRDFEPCRASDGRVYYPGEKTQDNCNECTCETLFGARSEWRCTNNVCLIRPELITDVNNGPYTWKASNYSKLWGLSLDEGVRYRLGTFQLPTNVVDMTAIRVLDDEVIPERFDAREKWPNMLHPIRDQGNCASSWAHSTTAVASDRLSIESEGAIRDELSAQHLLSCNTNNQLGCEGGHLDRAWWYLRKFGVVTEKCYPYASGGTNDAGQCLIDSLQSDGICPSGIQYKSEKRYHATPPYRIRPIEREIMKEIMDNGPVQATILVREDFFMYNRGIYSYANLVAMRREPEQYLKSGFHSVRIIGWGAERTPQAIVKYWICANSWGPEWGENGYFRIRRGSDESSIESYVIGVWGKISGDEALNTLLLENRKKRLRSERKRRRRHLRHQWMRDDSRKSRRRRVRRHFNDWKDGEGKKDSKHKLEARAERRRLRRLERQLRREKKRKFAKVKTVKQQIVPDVEKFPWRFL